MTTELFDSWLDMMIAGTTTAYDPPADWERLVQRDVKAERVIERELMCLSISPGFLPELMSPSYSTLDTDVSSASSGIPGIGYYSGKGLKWLGEKVIKRVELGLILARLRGHYITLTKNYKTEGFLPAKRGDGGLERILNDVLELGRDRYPNVARRLALGLAMQVQYDSAYSARSSHHGTEESPLITYSILCITSLGLAVYTTHTPFSRLTSLSKLLHSLTIETQINLQHARTLSTVVSLIATELSASQYRDEYRDRTVEGYLDYRLWVLSRLGHRKGLLLGEDGKQALYELARHRMNSLCEWDGLHIWRPYEVAVLACYSNLHPELKDVFAVEVLVKRLFNSVLPNGTKLNNRRKDTPKWFRISCVLDTMIQILLHIPSLVNWESNMTVILLDILRMNMPYVWSGDLKARTIILLYVLRNQQPATESFLRGHSEETINSLAPTLESLRTSFAFARYDRELHALAVECGKLFLQQFQVPLSDPQQEPLYAGHITHNQIPFRVRLLIETLNPMARFRLPDLRGFSQTRKRRPWIGFEQMLLQWTTYY